MSIAVSVVVPTCRRNDLLARCLAALDRQSLAPNRYEIIVADDAQDTGTCVLVNGIAARCRSNIRYIAVGPKHGPAAARNMGWRAAHGQIIAFTDDDCIPQHDWLERGLEAIDGAAAAAGQVVVPLPPKPTDYERDCAGLSRGEFVTANCFCRRDALETIGGFDERFTIAWREDSDLQFTLLEHGYKIAHASDAIVVHPVRPAAWGISIRQQRKALFNALLYKKHPQFYRERIPRKPWNYYVMATALSGTACSVIVGIKPLAAVGAILWVALTAHFCVQRLRHTSRRPLHIAEMIITSAVIPLTSLYWHLRGLWRYRVIFR